MVRERIIPIFVPHLGCPRACVFCNQRRISGQTSETTPELLKQTVEEALIKLGDVKPQIAFYGGSFTAIEPHKQEALLTAAEYYVNQNLVSGIRMSTRPDAIDPEVIRRLKSYSVRVVELGCQSMDDRVLELSKRGHTRQDCITAAKLLKEAGFKVILQMMTGLPGDDGSQSISTAEEIIRLRPDGVRIYPTVVVKDTELYDMYLSGEYQAHTVEAAVEVCSRLYTMFSEAEIPIIRLGLNPTEELSSGAAVAGAYHPALGELVQSRVILKKIKTMLEDKKLTDRLVITVPKGMVSKTAGQKRCNIEELKRIYKFREIKISESPNCDISLQLL